MRGEENKMKKGFAFVSLLVAAIMLLTACGPATTPTVEVIPPTTEPPTAVPPTVEPPPAIGSPEHPIKVLFVPSVDANIIVTGGQVMADALNAATGLTFEVTVPTSYAATIEEMCASPTDTMAFIPALGYALASQQCGVDVAFKAIRYGFPVYWAAYIVKRDSPYQTLADLQGKTWGYGDQGSTSGYMVPTVELAAAGVIPGAQIQTGGHNQTVTAVYNGEVEFGTVFYSVPLKPDGSNAWSYADYLAGTVTADMYDVPAASIPNCAPNEDGKKLLCDGWRVLDARANIRTEAPDVVQKVRILTISQAVPSSRRTYVPRSRPRWSPSLRPRVGILLSAAVTSTAGPVLNPQQMRSTIWFVPWWLPPATQLNRKSNRFL
jgi:phosphonate transport system substrate-binding protein